MFTIKRALATLGLATGAALALAGCGGTAAPAATFDPNEKVTIDLAFWGNDVRAGLYDQAIAAFNEKYPNITVNTTFLDFPQFWEKRQTEAAGKNLPDVMQFDYSYLRQYSENGLLLDLTPYLGGIIDTEPLSDEVLSTGVVGDATYAIPTSTNVWGLFTNPVLLERAGVEDFAGGDWADYRDWLMKVSQGAGGAFWGGTDYGIRIQNFELQLRAEGKELFSEDGTPGFDEKRLAEFWNSTNDLRENDAVIPSQRLEEVAPKVGFDSALTAADLIWDNFGANYLAGLGADYTELGLQAPPVTKEGAKDLYMKPAMLHAIAANTDAPEASATLVNFLINSPESGKIFGTNRGLPASTTALEAADLNPLSQQVRDYEASVADRIGDPPPMPVVGYGTLDEKFTQLARELQYGTLTVDDAVSQFFSEMKVVLNQ
ncbi:MULTISPECIES: ABC transporter substrate-binding protein [unclassified Microbacterium]|uniref:ABC transporter substrate-binding protein n=1 Tax=unclassified Microbacterium TaxID=2609290 RepID=UPI003017F17D